MENPAKHKDVLIALRRIIQAIDSHSKQLSKTTGLTTPQLLVLQALAHNGEMTMGSLARELSLSQATITSILARLEKRQLLARQRGTQDKRCVYAHLTPKASSYLDQAPKPLQADFIERFSSLSEWEQNLIISSLQRVAHMMNADNIDAAPLLHLGAPNPAQPSLVHHSNINTSFPEATKK